MAFNYVLYCQCSCSLLDARSASCSLHLSGSMSSDQMFNLFLLDKRKLLYPYCTPLIALLLQMCLPLCLVFPSCLFQRKVALDSVVSSLAVCSPIRNVSISDCPNHQATSKQPVSSIFPNSQLFHIAQVGYESSFQITGHHNVAISELPLETTGIFSF